jgi:hypothetical protein
MFPSVVADGSAHNPNAPEICGSAEGPKQPQVYSIYDPTCRARQKKREYQRRVRRQPSAFRFLDSNQTRLQISTSFVL